MKHKNSQLSDELLFLIACCQIDPSEDDIEFIFSYLNAEHLDLLELNSDTPVIKMKEGCNTLISLASRHGILPLVYKTLKNLQPVILGSIGDLQSQSDSLNSSHNTSHITRSTLEHLLTDFKSAYSQIALRNMLMTSELIKIMHLLREKHIEALSFKGPTLSQVAYGDITLRQYSDLDILVDENQLYRTAELIVSQNYEPMDSIEFLKNEAKLHVEKNYEFYGRKNGIKVEIHWRLINSSFLKKFKNYDVFSEPKEVVINQTAIPTLDTKILLLYLCNHGASHMWERLEWIVDIDRLIRSEAASLDWDDIFKLASTLQSKTTLLLGLSLSRELFKTDLPSHVCSQLNTLQVSNLVKIILNTFNSDFISKDHTSHEKNLKVFQFHLALQDSFSTKVGFILQTLFGYSDRDVMMVNLPRPLFFLYYPLRILRIINKYIFGILKR